MRFLNYGGVIVLCIDCYSAMRMWSKGEIQGQATATDAMWQFDDQEIADWEQWFKDNHRRYVHLLGSDSISPSHNDAIDDLISLFYNGNDTLRHDYRMILWRLNEFYPINYEKVDGYERYLGVEKQVDSLLNFNTDWD